jgi:hypothetical protein
LNDELKDIVEDSQRWQQQQGLYDVYQRILCFFFNRVVKLHEISKIKIKLLMKVIFCLGKFAYKAPHCNYGIVKSLNSFSFDGRRWFMAFGY